MPSGGFVQQRDEAVDFVFVVEQAGGDADHRADVAVHRVADHAALHQLAGDLFAVLVLDAEEGETGGQLRALWRDQFDPRLFQQAILGIAVEFMDARLDLGLAQVQVQLERFVQRPSDVRSCGNRRES